MDLLLSAQSVGLVACVTAGCMVAGGVISRARAQRRADRTREPPRDTTPIASLVGGKRVLVAGVLKVNGSCCARLEDAMPVAATTFEQPRRKTVAEGTVMWCDRARHLHVDVGDVSIVVDGPVRVIVGADELYPACAFEKLRGRVSERLHASERKSADDPSHTPRHGVFRSVGHGDQVVIAGIVEPVANPGRKGAGPTSYRRAGGGWRLRPDETGTLRMWSRRRPRVRGAFGAISAYATAILL